MKEKSKSEVSIIGGADGPTSIFIAGRTRKKPLKVRIRNIIYRYRRKIVEKKVVADSHTLDELVQYAMNTYNLIETNSTERKYIEQQKNLKESLILQHKPEVLGEMKDIPKPDVSNEESVREYFCKIKTRSEMIAEMPDNVIPMNFHLYEIRIGDDSLEMEIDYIWNIFGISYSGNKKVMKQFEKISNQFETQSLFHIENVALFALQNNLRFLDGLLLSSILINLVLRPTLPILFQMYSIHLLQANIYNSVYQKTVHIRLCVGSLPTAQPYLNIASFPTYYNAYHSDLLDMFSCTNPPQIPILMFLLYHNDTIIKKEKELLRALLSQFCKLESVIYHPNY